MKNIVTHNGIFHSDEVLAIALLKCFIDSEFKTVRTRDQKIISGADMAVDVGGVYSPDDGQFDHHQESYEGNLASAGMVADYIVQEGFIIPPGLKKLISIIDKNDTGEARSEDSFIETIKSLNSIDIYSPTQDVRFDEAVAYAVWMIEGLLAVAPAIAENEVAKAELEEAIEKAIEVASSNIIEDTISFSKDDPFVPAGRLISYADISIQWDKGQSCWTVQMVPIKEGEFKTKLSLSPSGREDEVFCHKAGFIGKYHAVGGAVHPRVNGIVRTIPVED